MKKGLLLHLSFVAIVSLCAYTGLLADLQLGPDIPLLDKVQHFIVVGGIAFWWTAGWNDPQLRLRGVELPLVLVILLVASSGEEALQSLSPYRDPEIGDWLANITGVITFWWIGRRWPKAEAVAP